MSNAGFTAIQYMAMIMKAQKFKLEYVLEIVQIINNSYLSSKDVIKIMEQIFQNQKSAKILVAVNVLEYLIKNCNRNFHQAANRQSFQKCLLKLLKRQRGKTSVLKDIRSNTQNWSRIEAKTLYLIQLWYDAFILEQSKYPYIINTYKILRKQNIVFPPRNVNQKNLLAIKTQSPIFQNIQTIAQTDKAKFNKRLRAMGMPQLKDHKPKQTSQKKIPVTTSYYVDIEDISQKIAVIQSQEYEGPNVFSVIEKLKKDLEYGRVKPEHQGYWKQIQEAGERLIHEWQQKNADKVHENEQKFLQMKMGKLNITNQKQQKEQQINKSQQQKPKQVAAQNLMDTWDLLGDQPEKPKEQIKQQQKQQEINLLDL